ncbi:MAG: alpha/beta hydrolase [Bacteroidales bacterium]
MSDHPHAGQPVLHSGVATVRARLAMILVHGRGGSAEEMLTLAREFASPDLALLAPQAAGYTWYPYSFLAPIAANEPGITSGMAVLEGLVDSLRADGVTSDRIFLLGFSQGACLSLEFAARHARRYAGVIALSGGLIGPDATPRNYAGTFDQTPVLLGCSDVDPHIPVGRVRESAAVFRRMGAAVDERIYPRMGHTVNEDEIEAVRALLDITLRAPSTPAAAPPPAPACR